MSCSQIGIKSGEYHKENRSCLLGGNKTTLVGSRPSIERK
jgi:hypothetical protein